MKHIWILGLLIPMLMIYCTDDNIIPADSDQQELAYFESVFIYREGQSYQQIEGYVYWPDSTLVDGSEHGFPLVTAYYQGEWNGEDEIDTGGHYGLSGPHQDWPQGYYSLETDIIYEGGEAYQGHRSSYHYYQQETKDQHIYLSEDMTK